MRQHHQPSVTIRGKSEARLNVFLGEIRKILQHLRHRHSASQIVEHIRHRDTRTADAGFATANRRIDRNPFPIAHSHSLTAQSPPVKPPHPAIDSLPARINLLQHGPGPQPEPDPLTGRPSFIHGERIAAGIRQAGARLNRQRARGIAQTAFEAASWQSLPADVWLASLARTAFEHDIPLISLSTLGIIIDEEEFLTSAFLRPLPGGAEAKPFLDPERRVVYKLFDLKATGGLGKKLMIEVDPESDRFRTVPADATLYDTLEKLCVLHEAGACPTEIIGLAESGDYLIVKQPLCYAYDDFEEDRRAATTAIHAVMPKSSLGPEVRVFWLECKAWCLGDLHKGNIMREAGGAPTIIDALIGPLPPELLHSQLFLQAAVNRARDLREGRQPPPDDLFHNVPDDEL